MKTTYLQVPGRGLMNQTAFELRMKYLESLSKDIGKHVNSETIALSQVQNNIESFIGTIEIPLGLIGPILFNDKNKTPEWVHAAIATTEGALAASMNRGSKAISECGGFKAHIVHQKMLRTPMFTFQSMQEALEFDVWIKNNFEQIKKITQKHSNYANLHEINSVIVGKIIHLKFIYSTGDASGQNMTTSCTWNACLWIEENFQKQAEIEILHFVIDGNGSSDKKVSYYALQNGRGTYAISECFLTHEVIEKTLRTNAEDMFRSFNHSMAISRLDGMIGYNINVANTIAGIFGATGQDLASIHESSTAVLQMEKTATGLYVSLTLPNLVVGTVGGGTHLPVASKILELMDCKGAGKVARFAKLISGYALALEISTLAAIVSGQFARAHQKLGRNKPVKWLLTSEINEAFIKANIPYFKEKIISVTFIDRAKLDNGILTELTSKVSKKVIGFVQAEIKTISGETHPILLKSKALGAELLEGLRFMASNVNVALADTINRYKHLLEYKDSHLKEIAVYEALNEIAYPFMPRLYGTVNRSKREIHLLIMERLVCEKMDVFNAEDTPEKWDVPTLKNIIGSIHLVHASFLENNNRIPKIEELNYMELIELYQVFIDLNRKDYDYFELDNRFEEMNNFIANWEQNGAKPRGKLTLIHNDFNPRNVGVRKNGNPCIYDWELAVYGVPQRDIFEFLAFSLQSEINESDLLNLLKHHYNLVKSINDKGYNWNDYIYDFELSGQLFLVSRVNFYLTGSTLVNYSFIERVFKTSFSILDAIKQKQFA
jgi:hydroxymethylglutaryl-CoA reductase (NADPH)